MYALLARPQCECAALLVALSFWFCSFFCFCFCKLVFLCDVWIRWFLSCCGLWKGQLLWRNHMGSQELKPHCNMSSLLFYVKYALCISTTIKGIETFSTMCNWDAWRVKNVSEYFASCRVSASSCSVDVHTCRCLCSPWVIFKANSCC